jgi:hypothetical protein
MSHRRDLPPQRGFIPKPGVARNELPWDSIPHDLLPQRGFIHLPSCPSPSRRFISTSYSPPRNGIQSYRTSRGRRVMAFSPSAPRMSMPLPNTSPGKKSITGNPRSRMNSGPCCENIGSSGTSDTCGIEFPIGFNADLPMPQRRRTKPIPQQGRAKPMLISACLLPMSQGDSIPQPGVARNELPRECAPHGISPHRGFIHLLGRRPSTWRTQPRWGRLASCDYPGVVRRSSGQPRALRKIPVGEICAIRTVTPHRQS